MIYFKKKKNNFVFIGSFFNKRKLINGITVIEVLVACSIISVSMLALMQTSQRGIYLSNYALKKTQASLLLEEGAEAIKSIRDDSWTTIANLSLDTPYHLYFNTSTKKWIIDLSTTDLSGHIPTYPIDSIFDRTITVSSVGRNSDDDIVSSGGVIDIKTKKITIAVSWVSSSGSKTEYLLFYISDIFN